MRVPIDPCGYEADDAAEYDAPPLPRPSLKSSEPRPAPLPPPGKQLENPSLRPDEKVGQKGA
jgi:hypothetical protein